MCNIFLNFSLTILCFRLIIDKSRPEFEMKLPREVGRLGTKLMRSLNIEQQRAVLKALSLKDYALLQGLPGTGTMDFSLFETIYYCCSLIIYVFNTLAI